MILAWFTTVTSTNIIPGNFESFDFSLWVQVLIFWPIHTTPCNVGSAFFVEYGEVRIQEIDTCTDLFLQNRHSSCLYKVEEGLGQEINACTYTERCKITLCDRE